MPAYIALGNLTKGKKSCSNKQKLNFSRYRRDAIRKHILTKVGIQN
jgi:hypothetical protein